MLHLFLGCFFIILGLNTAHARADAVQNQKTPQVIYVGLPEYVVPAASFDPVTKKFTAPERSLSAQKSLDHSMQRESLELKMQLNGELRNYFQHGAFVPSDSQCVGAGRWTGRYRTLWKRPLIAFSQMFPGIRNYPGNYPTRAFNAQAQKMSREAYQRRKIASNQMRIIQTIPFTLLNGKRTFFVVSSEIAASGKEPGCGQHSLFLLIEKVGRRYLTRHERYQNNLKTCISHHFVSSFTTDNTIDQILLMSQSNQAQWFDILKYTSSSGFKQIYHGGGYQRNCNKKDGQ